MSEFISSADFLAVMQESFERGQELIFTPSGSSMLPMLDGKNDKVTFSKKPDQLKKYDVAFYVRRKTNQLVLHRMVGFTKDGAYIFSGDNQYYYEYGVGDDDVLALMTSFTHNGKTYRTSDLSYRFYIRRMMLKKRLRRFASMIYHKIFK
ncbi:S24/S26 family peptidase [Ruminococcus sp.]|uniref:S24/S26 family peptidase n=1 Tax=Ruminococcus sp. TaxID=41978 RepID=UPI002E8123F0|nr:S24/S26 family peptidase [Ruminococcus sp.]MEE3491372.1 S24/S26 family peptidase [Ruminococcus sp.]